MIFNLYLFKKINYCILFIFLGIKILRIICRLVDFFMYFYNLYVYVYIYIIYINLKVLNFLNLYVYVL